MKNKPSSKVIAKKNYNNIDTIPIVNVKKNYNTIDTIPKEIEIESNIPSSLNISTFSPEIKSSARFPLSIPILLSPSGRFSLEINYSQK